MQGLGAPVAILIIKYPPIAVAVDAARPVSADQPPDSVLVGSTRIDTGLEYSTPTSDERTPRGAEYHGPTSAIYDAERPNERDHVASDTTDAFIKTQLFAESARQRQLELVNLRSGRLDFAGLEPERGMQLLSLFWSRQQATGTVVYRPAFMRDMNCQESGPGQAAAADVCEGRKALRRKLDKAIYHPNTQILCKSNITTIQALLLFSDGLFSWCDEPSLSWHYLGIAINMIFDLGLHSEASTWNCSPEEVEISRRVFWAAFVMDKTQSIYQGRPPRLSSAYHNVPLMFMDEYEELEPIDTAAVYGSVSSADRMRPSPIYSVSAFEQLCKLSCVADRILCEIHGESRPARGSEALVSTAHELRAELMNWCAALPEHLVPPTDGYGSYVFTPYHASLPHILCTTLEFHALVILLHRPFVRGGHLELELEDGPCARDALSTCVQAAMCIDQLLRHYRSKWCITSPPYFVTYAAYVSATIHVRNVARRVDDLHSRRCLQNCLEILEAHQHVSRVPRRALGILLRLCRRLKVNVGDTRVDVDDTRVDVGDTRVDVDDTRVEVGIVRGGAMSISSMLNPEMADTETVQTDTGWGDAALASPDSGQAHISEDAEGQARGSGGPSEITDLDSFYASVNDLLEGWRPGVSFDLDPLLGYDQHAC